MADKQAISENISFEYITTDNMASAGFSQSSLQIPVDASNIHVDEAGVVYFNVPQEHLVERMTDVQDGDESKKESEEDNLTEVVDKSIANEVLGDSEHNKNSIDDPSQLHICPRCKAFFATSTYLKAHMKRKCIRSQNIGNPHKCEYCDLSFKQRFQLGRHMMQHTGERPYKCDDCDKSFLTKSHLKRHAVIHVPEDQLEHKCIRCDKVFAWASALDAHMKSHTGEKRFKCGICGRMFLHLNSFRSHMSNRHTVNGKYTCVVCKKCFDEATELILHMKTHNEQESVKCERCFAFFASLKDLETHLCTNFGGKPLLCHVCDTEFSGTIEYCNHECMQVNSNRVCGCCQKSLKSLWHLREHLITHTGERPFKCVQCLNTFRRKRELEIHMTRHGADRPFKCVTCSLTFTSDNYLKQHMRKEHREKKFVCEVCHHAFMHKCSLVNHMSFHVRTGNTKFGKKYHRDEGLLVKELVEERLEAEKKSKTCNLTEASDNSPGSLSLKVVEMINETSSASKDAPLNPTMDNAMAYMNNHGGELVIQMAIHDSVNDMQDKTESNDSDEFSKHVIEPNVQLECSAHDLSNVTTIYQTDQDGGLIVKCASCLQDFASHSALLRHRKEYHNDGKPYQCDHCSRTFAIAANLSQHRNIHNVKRKYSCNHCGKSYKITHKLREHLRIKHGENTNELTDLELQLQNSNYPSKTKNSVSTTTDAVNINSSFISGQLPDPAQSMYAIDIDSNADRPDGLTAAIVNPAMFHNINEEKVTTPSSVEAKNMLSNIVFVDAVAGESTRDIVTSEQVSTKRGDVSFLMNLSSLITELGNGLSNQRVILQDSGQSK